MKRLFGPSGMLSAVLFLVFAVTVAAQTVTSIGIEAESGNLSGQVQTVASVDASGQSFIQFLAAPTPSPTPTPPSPPGAFLETFDGSPSTPQPWNNLDWDVVQTSRDGPTYNAPESMFSHHSGTNCGDVASGGNHLVDTWPETVFQCNGHVMTSTKAGGYSAIYLSPPVLADWSSGSATIKFDVSTWVSSTRDWIDVWIIPFEDVMSFPFGIEGVDGAGEPNRAIQIDGEEGANNWAIRHNDDKLNQMTIPYGQGGIPGLTDVQSKVVRSPFEITITPNSIRAGYPGPNRFITANRNVGFTSGVVMLGHHSYNPDKGENLSQPGQEATSNTWHWDNVSVNPAKRFYQRQASPKRSGYVSDYNFRTLTFGEPVPANAELHFTGSCNVQVRDGAASAWRNATPLGNAINEVEHIWAQKVSIPQGKTNIEYRFQDRAWYTPSFGCHLANPTVKALL